MGSVAAQRALWGNSIAPDGRGLFVSLTKGAGSLGRSKLCCQKRSFLARKRVTR